MKKTLFTLTLITSFTIVSCSSDTTDNSTETEETTDQAIDENNDESPEDLEEEKELGRKGKLLTSLVGDYILESIDGLMGMNSMVEYSIHDAVWLASGSSNIGGTREESDIDLSNDEIKALNSALITVSEDLTVTFTCSGKTYISAPFNEEAMAFQFENSAQDYSSVINGDIKENTTFIKDELFLFAKDEIEESAIIEADLVGIGANTMLLKYNETSKEFQLIMFYGDGMDQATYIFK